MRVVVAFALDERVEKLRAEVRGYLRQQGATERPLKPEDGGSTSAVCGGFEQRHAAIEASQTLRRGIEAIVGPSGLTRLVVSVRPEQEVAPTARIPLRRIRAVDRLRECG